ncbi:ribosomal protein L25, Ctc-form [Rubidibacter lacunae KORDI 51-2]|uniref:Large ribosomal subunit protein bL25 n=1 Tax=Rubidibacter lacunae KORDI 51-2 TaxID=582515 RepID=U5DG36_9CHRO|nr:50S ribosomal protein L25/general stress protein Ctc [Rubidibacter lacunae]ERN40556.1 ribosomal protein L25, Ctc-form [Rubidibacter lacunae KORDI 51-2]
MSLTIECQKRPEGSKSRALRREGLIPANLYGHSGTESMSLVVNERKAQRLLRSAAVNSTVIDVQIPDLSWSGPALIREVQTHPWKAEIYHLSFFAVRGRSSVDVVVPLNIVGVSAGAKQGGVLDQVVTELAVRCDPTKVPESIDIDVTTMDVGTVLTVGELVLPDGVAASTDPSVTVLSIIASRTGAAQPSEAATESETAE